MVLQQPDEKKSYLTTELHFLFPQMIQFVFVNKCSFSKAYCKHRDLVAAMVTGVSDSVKMTIK